MKILKLLLAVLILSAGVACRKTSLPTLNVSMDDAASMLAGSLSTNSYGVNNISGDVSGNALLAMNVNQACGSTKIDTFIRKSATPASGAYYYKLIYQQKLNCNASNLPDNISSNLTFSGYYSNSKLSLTNTGTANFVLSGLTSTATVHAINGEYKSMGTFRLKSDTTNTGSANIDIVVKNLIITKSTQTITGGTATVIITGTTSKKGDFTYNGILTFTANLTATMVINGTTYTVNLATGIVTRK